MKKFLRLGIVAALMALCVPLVPYMPFGGIANAQTTVTSTTTSAAVTATQKTVTVASATNVTVGQYLFIDRELMQVNAVVSTVATVQRGIAGTVARAHASGAVVWAGAPSNFYQSDVWGTCTSTSELYLPHINPQSGNVFQCHNSTWQRYVLSGIPTFSATILSQTYTAAGAIDVQPGIVFINGTTLAMTLANPTTAQNGMVMVIESTNASAHTVTYTAGFNGGTTARDVATYGGAIGDNMVIFANAGVWWVISTRNVTFG